MDNIFLESKDRRGGLLIKIESESVFTCTYSTLNALSFKSNYAARKFIKENKLKGKFKPIFLE